MLYPWLLQAQDQRRSSAEANDGSDRILTCRYLVSKIKPIGDEGEEVWVYGYVCGEPTLDRRTSACSDHFYPRYSPFPAIARRRTPKR
jgi:hypothetical protein